jgi:hypothetical protein
VIKQPLNPFRGLFFASLLLIAALAPAPSFAQQQKDQPPAASAQQQGERKTDDSSSSAQQSTSDQKPAADDKSKPPAATQGQHQSGTSNDRLFWTLPNFLTVENASRIPPLTAGQKFKVVARSTFDPVEFAFIGFVAGIGQATNSEPGYGQGAEGYGKRYGASFADNTIENFLVGAALPSLLHQDPRYFQLGRGSFLHRTGYAIKRIIVTRTDSGNGQFNYSEIFGAAIGAGISTYSYHPQGDRNLTNTASVWGTQIGWDAVSTIVKEFWPDIRRHFKKQREPMPATDSAP